MFVCVRPSGTRRTDIRTGYAHCGHFNPNITTNRRSIGVHRVDVNSSVEFGATLCIPSGCNLIPFADSLTGNILMFRRPHRRICECIDWLISLKDGQLLFMVPISLSIATAVTLNPCTFPKGSLPKAFECRDAFLDKWIGSHRPAEADSNAVQLEVDSRTTNGVEADTADSTTPVIHKPMVEKSEPHHVDFGRQISLMYGGDIARDNDGIDYGKMAVLIEKIVRDAHSAANAADYLYEYVLCLHISVESLLSMLPIRLETEYLSSTHKLREHWLQYRNVLYPDWDATLHTSSDALLLSDHRCLGCDANYCSDFARCDTYVRALRAFVGLSKRSFRYYVRKWWIVVLNLAVSAAAALVSFQSLGVLCCGHSVCCIS